MKYRPCGLILVLTFIFLLPIEPALARNGDNFLWQVNSGHHNLYLMGSIHLAKPDLYPLDPCFEEAFADSEVLVVEADVTAVAQDKLQTWLLANGLYPPEDSLEKHLSDKTKTKLAELDVDLAAINRFRPWLAAITIQTQKLNALGFNEKYGLDRYFLEKASGRKKIKELEGMDAQLRIFQRLSPADQELFLYSTLEELENTAATIDRIIQCWRSGDAAAFEKIFFRDYTSRPESQRLVRRVIFERNRKMQARIEKFLKTGPTHFVIVGAGHLVGAKGIVSGLKAKGYQVKQL
ncbi:MAG: TraB/GumN family protein [Thermodesulfobacteriota bacterium]